MKFIRFSWGGERVQQLPNNSPIPHKQAQRPTTYKNLPKLINRGANKNIPGSKNHPPNHPQIKKTIKWSKEVPQPFLRICAMVPLPSPPKRTYTLLRSTQCVLVDWLLMGYATRPAHPLYKRACAFEHRGTDLYTYAYSSHPPHCFLAHERVHARAPNLRNLRMLMKFNRFSRNSLDFHEIH